MTKSLLKEVKESSDMAKRSVILINVLERIFRKLKIFKNITYPSKKQVQGIQEIVLEPEIKYD